MFREEEDDGVFAVSLRFLRRFADIRGVCGTPKVYPAHRDYSHLLRERRKRDGSPSVVTEESFVNSVLVVFSVSGKNFPVKFFFW